MRSRVKNKPKRTKEASDISRNDSFTGNLSIAIRLARTVEGRYAETLLEFLDYDEYLASQRSYFSDLAILLFYDDFRTFAKTEGYSLTEYQHRNAIAAHFMHSEFRRQRNGAIKLNYFREPYYNTTATFPREPAFRVAGACRVFNRRGCNRENCTFGPVCGHRGENHHASSCSKYGNGGAYNGGQSSSFSKGSNRQRQAS